MAREEVATGERGGQGPGRHTDDGAWWWDDGLRRWFRTAEDMERVEVALEDYGGTSLLRRIGTTLTGQYGTQLYRFVARPQGDEAASSTPVAVSGTFPASPLDVTQDDVHPRNAWSEEAAGRLAEMEAELEAAGWRVAEHGAHWWSRLFERPRLDHDTPHDATPPHGEDPASGGG